jgi:hypothetical protein
MRLLIVLIIALLASAIGLIVIYRNLADDDGRDVE